jgi:rRNA-processing protein FCF1
MPLPVIMDTNFLTVPAQFGVDVFSEAERVLERSLDFVLLDSVLEEIRSNLKKASRTEARMFRVALDLVDKCTVVNVADTTKSAHVDDQLLDYAKSVEGVLATNDRDLRERASSQGIPVLILRGKKHLELEGSII